MNNESKTDNLKFGWGLVILTIFLVGLKSFGLIDISWWLALLPLYIGWVFLVLFILLMVFLVGLIIIAVIFVDKLLKV